MAPTESLPTDGQPSTSSPETNGIPAPFSAYKPCFVDIGINLTDHVYTGLYHGTQRHTSDMEDVVKRAREIGCEKLIVTGSDLEHSERAVQLAKEFPGTVYATIGVHPCNAQSLTPPILTKLEALTTQARKDGYVVAFGEIGLDYDRLELCPKDVQLKAFAQQLEIAVKLHLPLFLHSRAAHEDFVRILSEHEKDLPKRGVVHSFTGTVEEMRDLVDRGWDIGVNGCSMKTTENCAVVKEIPIERLQIETDGPWCEIRGTHASMQVLNRMREGIAKEDSGVGWGGWKSVKKEKWVKGAVIKGRNEPCFIGRVAWAVAGIKGLSVQELSEAAWANSVRMFGVGVVESEKNGKKEVAEKLDVGALSIK